MAIQFELYYTSRLAQHIHILWTADHYANRQVSVPAFIKEFVLKLPISSFNQTVAPLKYRRFYPAKI